MILTLCAADDTLKLPVVRRRILFFQFDLHNINA